LFFVDSSILQTAVLICGQPGLQNLHKLIPARNKTPQILYESDTKHKYKADTKQLLTAMA
jgi:hypothetical protein